MGQPAVTVSQINEDTVEPSLSAQNINPIAYVPDLIFAPHAGFVPGSVQLIRPVRILSLAVAHSTVRPNRQPNFIDLLIHNKTR